MAGVKPESTRLLPNAEHGYASRHAQIGAIKVSPSGFGGNKLSKCIRHTAPVNHTCIVTVNDIGL
jgi:hypothetical protein